MSIKVDIAELNLLESLKLNNGLVLQFVGKDGVGITGVASYMNRPDEECVVGNLLVYNTTTPNNDIGKLKLGIMYYPNGYPGKLAFKKEIAECLVFNIAAQTDDIDTYKYCIGVLMKEFVRIIPSVCPELDSLIKESLDNFDEDHVLSWVSSINNDIIMKFINVIKSN